MESGLRKGYRGGAERSSEVGVPECARLGHAGTPSVESDLPKGYRCAAERSSEVGVPECETIVSKTAQESGYLFELSGTAVGWRRGRRGWSAVASCEDSFHGIGIAERLPGRRPPFKQSGCPGVPRESSDPDVQHAVSLHVCTYICEQHHVQRHSTTECASHPAGKGAAHVAGGDVAPGRVIQGDEGGAGLGHAGTPSMESRLCEIYRGGARRPYMSPKVNLPEWRLCLISATSHTLQQRSCKRF
jgi:hypothetical protein